MSTAAKPPIRVLVVDDSAVVRQVLADVLSREPDLAVQVAADAVIAREKIRRARPDAIVLDLELPRLDGLAFLRQLMAEDPIPVVVCSGIAQRGTEAALRATAEGAVAVVAKPAFDVRGFLRDAAMLLADEIRGAAQARIRPRGPLPVRRAIAHVAHGTPPDVVVALGASTGGTEAIAAILEAMPRNAPGVVIVQHMPEGFTRAFADRLDRTSAMEVREAVHGDEVRPGLALIAPGNRHLSLARGRRGYVVEVADGPPVSRHRPSVDVLFHSVARTAGRRAVAALLTGMGADGADGLAALRSAGAATLAQDEASCVVFGMPREAIRRGAAQEIVPLAEMPAALLRAGARP